MKQTIPKIPMTREIKALLLSIGTADIQDENLVLPTLKSTAGPSAGSSGSVFIASNGRRVRLNSDKNSPVKIRRISDAGDIAVFVGPEQTRPLLIGKVEPALAHCPEQAYINLSEKCIFDCKYCSVPLLQGKTKTKEESLRIIENAFLRGNVKAVSITSGVEISPADELERVLALLPELKKYNVPIGVSVYAVPGGSEKLKKAGVSEVKYNIEAAESALFKQVCPDLSEADVFAELEEAVRIFGRGSVFSNVIVGLGETDENVEERLEELAGLGVIACIRPIYENVLRKGECIMKRPSAERLLKLFEMQSRISEKYGLHPEKAQTMCALCSGCDMVPGKDD